MALAATPNPALAGEPVTLTATVTGHIVGFPPTPTGTVTFKDGASVLGTVTLPAAQPTGDPFAVASLTVSNLAPGTHALTAVYTPATTNPDPTGDPGWIQVYHDITTSPTVNLVVTGRPVAVVTLSNLQQTYTGTPHEVTVTTDPPGLPVTVTYNDSTQPPVKAGTYTVLAVVNHPVYTGSAGGTLVISKARIRVHAEPASRPYGTPNPAFRYTLSGFVNGEDASVVRNQPTLTCDAGQYSKVGSYTIEVDTGALEAENYEFEPWVSKLYVVKALTTTQLRINPGPLKEGQPVTITAAVAREQQEGPFPGGSLAFRVDGTPAGMLALVDGEAELVLNDLTAGSHTVTADYLPDGNHTASQAQLTFTVGYSIQVFLPWVEQ